MSVALIRGVRLSPTRHFSCMQIMDGREDPCRARAAEAHYISGFLVSVIQSVSYQNGHHDELEKGVTLKGVLLRSAPQ